MKEIHRKDRKKLDRARELLIKNKKQEARRLCEQVLRQHPENGYAHDLLGIIEADAKKLTKAIRHFYQAIEQGAANYGTYNNLGLVLHDQGNLDEAIEMFQKALRENPGQPQIYTNLGTIYNIQRRFREGKEAYAKALSILPHSQGLRHRLIETLWELGEMEQARQYLEAGAKADDNFSGLIYSLHTLQNLCAWQEWSESLPQLKKSIEEKKFIIPFITLSVPLTLAEQQMCARNWAREEYGFYINKLPAFEYLPHEGSRLRIGYMSSDLREHPVGHIMAGVFEKHNKDEFEIIAYSYGEKDDSPMKKRLQKSFDKFNDVRKASPSDMAKRIRADNIDILIDLNGYTRHTRSGILASRLAPVQAQYLGYAGTLGSRFVDYIIADEFVIPRDKITYYDEKVVWLPDSYIPRDDSQSIGVLPTREEAGLPRDKFVFCSFNQAYKILPEMFDVWMEILRMVPESVLWLMEYRNITRENLRREANNRDVEPNRLIFAPRTPEIKDHFARFSLADLYLDTFPYNGHSTMGDALFAGVPGISLSGETFPSRVGGSLLKTAGLKELITYTLEDYRSLAVRLATNPSHLSQIREYLSKARARKENSLFNTAMFTTNLENAYKAMWERFQSGLPPDHIIVSATSRHGES